MTNNLTPDEERAFQEYLNKKNGIKPENQIFLLNDDSLSFQHVMLSLMNNCDFDQYQAEQVAIITTCNGKCPIRTGIREDLEPLANALTEEGLTVKLV